MNNDHANEKDTRNGVNPLLDPEKQIQVFGKGKMKLATPILSRDENVTELMFDFTALTGREFVAALDLDNSARTNAFRITDTQAFNLFAEAAGKATEGIDATDIRERMGALDSVKAVQLATVFFSAANRAGNKRISNE